jgi:hypothetical protein
MEQLERIRTMEEKLNAALAAIASLETALDGYRDAMPCIRDLEAYLASDEWRQDFEADEQGRLPAGLRRGVLSEDGIYRLLEADSALRDELALLGAGASPRREKEYRLVEVRLGEAEDTMNAMARDGWEVAGTAFYPGGAALTKAGTVLFITFARDVSDE